MSYHGTGLRSSTSVKPTPKVHASKRTSHLAEFGTRAKAYYGAGWDLPAKKSNLIVFKSFGDMVVRLDQKPLNYNLPQPPVGGELRQPAQKYGVRWW